MDAEQLFSHLKISFNKIKTQLSATSRDAFEKQFKEVFSSEEARSATNVVYVWSTEKPIPRLRGSSDIIYIGKTIQSLFHRHAKYAPTEANEYNFRRYHHIISDFGPITISFADQNNPKETEAKMLEAYEDKHLEIPPINRMSR